MIEENNQNIALDNIGDLTLKEESGKIKLIFTDTNVETYKKNQIQNFVKQYNIMDAA